MMNIAASIDQLIGNTPLMRLTRLEQKLGLQGQLLAKLEYFNPGGSIKIVPPCKCCARRSRWAASARAR